MDINCIQEAREVFDIEISELEKVKNKIDDRFEKTVNLIYGLKNNKVVVTGIGKSGLIGKKIAATLASTGTSAIFVNAAEALHGDLGMISNGDVVIAMAASTDSAINKLRFNGADYAPTASAELLFKAYEAGKAKGLNMKSGNVLTSDTFYGDDPEGWKKWAKFGVLCVEMETAQLYTTAAKFGVNALTLLTISDSLVTGEVTSAEERQLTFNDMIEVALESVLSL